MGALLLAVQAEIRHRWRSWMALAVLVGMAGGARPASLLRAE